MATSYNFHTIRCFKIWMKRGLVKNNFNVKVRRFRGSSIKDMYDYLAPLLQKKPEYVVLHVSTNESSDNVLNELIQLQHYVESSVPGITVIISEPITRYDDNALACLRVRHLKGNIRKLNIKLIDNSNIVRKHVGKGGLHMNNYDAVSYAVNIISLIKRL